MPVAPAFQQSKCAEHVTHVPKRNSCPSWYIYWYAYYYVQKESNLEKEHLARAVVDIRFERQGSSDDEREVGRAYMYLM